MSKAVKRRLFFGLELPEALKSTLLSVQQPLEGARWQVPEQLHLTLFFLGTVPEPQVQTVQSAVQTLSVEPFTLSLSGLGCFGAPESPKVLWADIEPCEPLDELQLTLRQRLVHGGFQQETRLFHPHITLARFRQPSGSVRRLLASYRDYAFGTVSVTFLSLFEGEPTPEGPRYSVLNRTSLNQR